MGFAKNLEFLLKWDVTRDKGRKRDDQMGIVTFSKVKWVKKEKKNIIIIKKRKKKTERLAWCKLCKGEEVGWGGQNMGLKYKENFLGKTTKLFWGTIL